MRIALLAATCLTLGPAPVLHAQEEPEGSPELTVQIGHREMVSHAAFTPGGLLVSIPMSDTSAGSEFRALVWDVATARELFALEIDHTIPVTALAVSPGVGEAVITGDAGGSLFFTEVATGQSFPGPEGLGYIVGVGITIEPETFFTVVNHEGVVRRFDDDMQEQSPPFEIGRLEVEFQAALSPDGRTLVRVDEPGLVQLWNTDTGTLIGEYGIGSEDGEPVWAGVAIAPDGSWASVLDSAGRFFLWQLPADPEHPARFDGADNLLAEPSVSIAIPFEDSEFDVMHRVSPDGRFLFVAGMESTAVWDLGTGEFVRSIEGMPLAATPDSSGLLTMPFSWTGSLFSNTLELTSVRDEYPPTRFRGFVAPLSTMDVMGPFLVTGGDDGVFHLWDVMEGVQVDNFRLGEAIHSVGFSAFGDRVFASTESGDVSSLFYLPPEVREAEYEAFGQDLESAQTFVWDLDAVLNGLPPGEGVRESAVAVLPGRVAALFPDGTSIVTGDDKGNVVLWDIDRQEPIDTLLAEPGRVTSLALSADGARLAAGFEVAEEPGLAVLLDLGSGESVRFETDGAAHVALDAQGVHLVVADGQAVRIVVDGEMRDVLEGARATLSPDGALLAVASEEAVRLYDVETLSLVHEFGAPHMAPISDLAFAPDGPMPILWTAGRDGMIVASTGDEPLAMEPMARLIPLFDHDVPDDIGWRQNEWAVQDAEGRFDASSGGEVEGLHWVIGTEVIELEQLRDVYFEPGLLSKILYGFDEGLQDVVDLSSDQFELPPDLTIVEDEDPNDARVKVKVEGRSGGIGPVAVFVNGREFMEDARPDGVDPNASELTFEIDLSTAPNYEPGGDNFIEVIPSTEANVQGRGGRVATRRTTAEKKETGRFFAVVAGVSKYSGARDLKFASKDARVFGAAIERAAKGLYVDDDKVDVQILTDDTKPASRENLLAALDGLDDVQRADTVLLFLAGHGVAHDGDYYYLTCEATSTELSKDAAERREVTVSGAELKDWIKKLPSRRVVVILDTCSSGQMLSGLTQARGGGSQRALMASHRKALEELKDRTGTFFLAGSAPDQESFESNQYGQGLLTYCLLRGMKGAVLDDGPEVDVMALFGYAVKEVPPLARKLNRYQQPEVSMPRRDKGGGSFPIGRLEAKDRDEIPLPSALPLVRKSDFQLASESLDPLDLEDKVDNALEEHTGSADASFAFVKSDKMASSYRLGGRYTQEGDVVTVDVSLYKDGKKVTEKPERIEGKKSELDQLVAKIVAVVDRIVK